MVHLEHIRYLFDRIPRYHKDDIFKAICRKYRPGRVGIREVLHAVDIWDPYDSGLYWAWGKTINEFQAKVIANIMEQYADLR